MGKIDRSAPVEIRIQAHAILGRANAKLGSRAAARTEYEKVRAAWANKTAVLDELTKLEPDELQRDRRRGKILTSVGEALFFFAEEKKSSVDAIAFPKYQGSGERAEVERFIKTKVADWQGKKRTAIDEADKAYAAVLDLEPPPPSWVIASGARAGGMRSKFVAEFRAAPIPKEWLQNGPSPYGDLLWEEIRGAYYAELDRVSEPDKQTAKLAMEKCLGYAVKFQHFDDSSRTCERWLSKEFPAQYHLLDEFRSAANRLGSGANERAIAVNMDGTPHVGDGGAAATKSGPAAGRKP
jgi:hypothetical protein